MLSKQVKQRIAKNKKRRIQCRTKNGRDLYRLIRSVRTRTTNWAVENLFRGLPVGGFKRGILPIIASRGRLRGEGRSDMRPWLEKEAARAGIPVVRTVTLEHDAEFVLGIDPAAKETGVVTVRRAKNRNSVAGVFDVKMDFDSVKILDESHLLKGGDIRSIFTDREAMRRVVDGVKDGSLPSITVDSFSDFGARGHVDKDGKFTMDSVNLIDNPEKNNAR